MKRQLGVVMEPSIDSIIPKKDSTLAILLAAQARDWEIQLMGLSDLSLGGGDAGAEVLARWRPLQVMDDLQCWSESGELQPPQPLAQLDCVLMRADPPVDARYIAATWLLEAAQKAGDTLVVNAPDTLRDLNEK